jgi:CheY-like chemotaxis protein
MQQINITHFLLVCHHNAHIAKNLLSVCRGARCLHSVQEASLYIERKKPVAVVSEMELEDGDIWQLVNIIRSGRICRSNLPVIGITFGELCPALERLAALRHVYLYNDPDLSDLPQYLDEVLAQQPVPPHVLLIEDDKLIAEHIANVLGKSFSIQVAGSVSEGLALFASCNFNLVILDLCLPDGDGMEVLEQILAINRDQPVLILSGRLDGDSVRAVSLGGATLCADKEILGMPQILMRRCIEAMELKNLNAILKKERRFIEQAKLVKEAREILSLAQIIGDECQD